MDFLLDDLNDAQREAVTYGEGPLLVVAGAGSGKTRVLTRRIAWLLHHGVPEWAVLGVTFTNKAAREMAGRVHDLVPGSRIRLSTFHSACASFLRRSGERLGFTPDFTIYDTQDRDQLIKTLMHDRDMPVKEVRPSLIGHVISSLKNAGTLPRDYVPDEMDPVGRFVGRLYEPYQDALRSMNAMDFDDLLLHFLGLVESEPDVCEYYASRYRHVLVDEFQDTNNVQYRIVKALSSVHGNLCVVGDPDQSIYSFRGAVVGNILSFPKDYPATKVVKLETNYRSRGSILEFAQTVIEHNRERLDKVLVPSKPGGPPIEYHTSHDTREEAREVAYRVTGLVQRGVPLSEIAIFYRARFLSRGLEEVFRSFNLPYELVGDVGFYGRKEIKDLLAYLQIIVNPRDTVALQRIINVPTRGIGKVTQDRVFAAAASAGMTPGEMLLEGMTSE
ncbi:MAG: UvrD-helicase domain-containing protein, partial [Planctomycetes bacterium]|nr:UvrD-helicase domain-containing protein [Planctomycetota bacterium]